MSALIQFFHILCGVTFLGIMIASFFYIAHSIGQDDSALMHYAIKTSFFGDVVIFPIVLSQFITGALLALHHHIPFHTPWIIVAFHLFGLAGICWACLLWIKYRNKKNDIFRYKKLFYGLNVFVLILFVFIIHDAVTQSTWFYFKG